MAGRSTAVVERGEADVEGARSKRADAQRNYERLVLAARTVFSAEGAQASMEAVAREAGVGVGTLYRHFPKRIDLVEAVYRNDVDELVQAAEVALEEHDAWGALVAWMDAFCRYAQAKRTLLSELAETFEKNPDLRVATRERIEEAMAIVFVPAQRAGVVRSDIDGAELMQLLGSMCTNASLGINQIERLLHMILDGLRTPA